MSKYQYVTGIYRRHGFEWDMAGKICHVNTMYGCWGEV